MENRIRTLGICAVILIVSLNVVGIVSHGIIRHTVQTASTPAAGNLSFPGYRLRVRGRMGRARGSGRLDG